MLERERSSATIVREPNMQGIALQAGHAVVFNQSVEVPEFVDGCGGWNQLDPLQVRCDKLNRGGVFDLNGNLEPAPCFAYGGLAGYGSLGHVQPDFGGVAADEMVEGERFTAAAGVGDVDEKGVALKAGQGVAEEKRVRVTKLIGWCLGVARRGFVGGQHAPGEGGEEEGGGEGADGRHVGCSEKIFNCG